MPHRHILLLTLLSLTAIGIATLLLMPSQARPTALQLMWWLFLVMAPLLLATVILMGWAWAAMACVVYGTIGLALDLATVVSILGGQEGPDLTLALSVVSGGGNFTLIVFGGRAFWTVLQRPAPQ